MKKQQFCMTHEQRQVAARCLDDVADSVRLLAEHGQEVAGMVSIYAWLRKWLVGDGSHSALSAKLREIRELRDVLDKAAPDKAPGDPRLDSAVRSCAAWMLWRVTSFMLGQHDASVAVWTRMGLAQVTARYEGVTPAFTEGDASSAGPLAAPAAEAAGDGAPP